MPMFGALEVGVESAGVLIAPTGRIAAGDPHLCLNSSPDFALRFTAEVPAGRYPLELCTVAVEDASGAVIDHRNAAARLRVSDAPVALWEMGVAEGMDLARLGDDQFFGYPVDTACGSSWMSPARLRRDRLGHAGVGRGVREARVAGCRGGLR